MSFIVILPVAVLSPSPSICRQDTVLTRVQWIAGVDVTDYQRRIERREPFRLHLCPELQALLVFYLWKHNQTPDSDIAADRVQSQRLLEEVGLDFNFKHGLSYALKGMEIMSAQLALNDVCDAKVLCSQVLPSRGTTARRDLRLGRLHPGRSRTRATPAVE